MVFRVHKPVQVSIRNDHDHGTGQIITLQVGRRLITTERDGYIEGTSRRSVMATLVNRAKAVTIPPPVLSLYLLIFA